MLNDTLSIPLFPLPGGPGEMIPPGRSRAAPWPPEASPFAEG